MSPRRSASWSHLLPVLLALAAVLTAACERSAAKPSAQREDAATAKARVVSVGSAITEIVYALGAGDQIVGVDTSSLFPEAATKLPQVGYQRTLAAEGILALKPTVLVASAEAGPPAVLEQIKSAGVRVEVLGADATVAGAKARIAKVADLLGRDASKVLAEFDADLANARARVAKTTTRPKVLALYARGANTLHVFGKNTSAEAMLRLAGADNAVTGFEGSKPVTSEALVQASPDVILIPSRGLHSLGGIDGLLKVPGVAETPAARTKRIVAMDDLLLLGFGPRTGKAALELTDKLHPELAPLVTREAK